MQNGPPARQADLPAMGVSAKHQIIPCSGSLLVWLRAVTEQNGRLSFRYVFTSFAKIVRLKEARIINPAKPDSLALPLKRDRLIKQHWQTGRLEKRYLLDKIVISECAV